VATRFVLNEHTLTGATGVGLGRFLTAAVRIADTNRKR